MYADTQCPELANDPNVDLVVSCIRADRHAGSLIPSIKASKDVFVEWPIEANYAKAKELTDLVKAHGVRNVVGLQGSFAPVARKVKTTIERGDIGRVEGSTMIAKNAGGATRSSHVDYFADKKIGGNPFTIAFGHSMEFITEVLGQVSSHHSLLVNQYPEIAIVDPATYEVVERSRKNDVPNQVVFDAIMKPSGAVFTYKLHNSATISPGAKPRKVKGRMAPALDWRIFGSKGEIRITSYNTWSLNAGTDDLRLEICKADEGVFEEVDLGADEFEHLPMPARNIARLYEAYAAGVDDGGRKREWYPDFEYALKRHELIEEMYKANGF